MNFEKFRRKYNSKLPRSAPNIVMTCASIYHQQIIEVRIIIYEESRNFINDKKYDPSTAQILM